MTDFETIRRLTVGELTRRCRDLQAQDIETIDLFVDHSDGEPIVWGVVVDRKPDGGEVRSMLGGTVLAYTHLRVAVRFDCKRILDWLQGKDFGKQIAAPMRLDTNAPGIVGYCDSFEKVLPR